MFAALTAGTIRAFLSVEGGAAEFRPPAPSGGKWEGEEEMGAEDVRVNEPSIFMTATQESSADTDTDPTATN